MGLIACFMLPMVCHVPLVMQSPLDWVMHPESMLQISVSTNALWRGCRILRFSLFPGARRQTDGARTISLRSAR